jgi:hypothetical protein
MEHHMHTPEKIAKAIKYVVFAKKPVTVENVNRYMQRSDHITQKILDAHIAAAGVPRNDPAPQQQEARHDADDTTDAAAPDEPAENVVQLATPGMSLAVAQRRLVESQVALRTASQRVRECRAALGAALARWQQAIGAVVTPEQNARAFIASETALRQARKDGLAPQRGRQRHHRSVVDATAAAYNTGSNRAGGGNAFRRIVKGDDGQWHRPVDVHSIGRR